MARAFISHVAEDEVIADRLKHALKRDFPNMLEVFSSSDTESVRAGALWFESIERALRDSKILMVLCSPESVRQPWINFEAGAAWMLDIPVVPVCYAGLNASEVPMPLKLRQGICLTTPKDLRRLYGEVAEILNCGFPAHVDFDRLAQELRVEVRPRLVLNLDTAEEVVTNKLSQPAALYSRAKIPNPGVPSRSEDEDSQFEVAARSQVPGYFIRACVTNQSSCAVVYFALHLTGVEGPQGKVEMSRQRLRWSDTWWFEPDPARSAVLIRTEALQPIEIDSGKWCHCDVCFHYDLRGPERLGEFQKGRVYFAVNKMPSVTYTVTNGTYVIDLQLHARFSDGTANTLDRRYEMVVNLDDAAHWPDRVRFRNIT